LRNPFRLMLVRAMRAVLARVAMSSHAKAPRQKLAKNPNIARR
jgi:hypothetical protein